MNTGGIILIIIVVLMILGISFVLIQSSRGKDYYPFKSVENNPRKLHLLNIIMLLIGVAGVAGLYFSHGGNAHVGYTIIEVIVIIGTIYLLHSYNRRK